MPNFTLKTTPVSKSDNPSHWKYTQCEIFQDGVKIGEFERNYPHHAEGSFKPFKIDGQWYATYSSKYNKLSIMTLPDCKHWCDVEHTPDGVCPTEVVVNRYINFQYSYVDGKQNSKIITEKLDIKELKETFEDSDINLDDLEDVKKHLSDFYTKINSINLISIDDDWTYNNKIIFEGCYWGGPYDLWWIDVSNISQMNGKQIPINFLAAQLETDVKISLQDRVNFEDDYVIVLVEKTVDFNKKG